MKENDKEIKPLQVIEPHETGIEIHGEGIDLDRLYTMAQHAEKRVEAVKKVKNMALRITNYNDWVDQGGKPYLQASGAEKIARLFGISWRFTGDIERKDEIDGHFSYEVPMEFIMSGVSVQFKGSRSSKDPFFSKKHGEQIPPSEIDKTDVMKAAITNTIVNGITRLLGIRNLTWEDLKSVGIDISKISKVEYKTAKKDNFLDAKPQQQQQPQTLFPQQNPNVTPLTDKQFDAIQRLKNTLKYSDEDLLVIAQGIINRKIEALQELTRNEAIQVIEALQKERDKT